MDTVGSGPLVYNEPYRTFTLTYNVAENLLIWSNELVVVESK